MVSHKHKCIFIHISKCAGTTVEQAFGMTDQYNAQMGYGWNTEHKLHMQHATPKQVLDSGLVTQEQWDSYYKFVIVRNPWARAYSDYSWVMVNSGVYGTFKQFLKGSGPFYERLNVKNNDYLGDHLTSQFDYLHLDNKPVAFNCIIRMEDIKTGFTKVIHDLKLPADFFNLPQNVNNKKLPHYSFFYNWGRAATVSRLYSKDIAFLTYSFVEKRKIPLVILSDLALMFGPRGKVNFRLKYPYLAYKWGRLKRAFKFK